MIEFEEPGDEYDLEKVKKSNLKVKIRVATLFIVFLLLILFLVKNNFNFNFFKTEVLKIEEKCDPKYSYNRNDAEEIYLEKANMILEKNHSQFRSIEGFDKALIESEQVGLKGASRPVIKFFFKDNTDIPVKIPKYICGYRVEVFFQ
ncbi:MAG: hypothetical protein U9M90_00320 [Patescibacteria group bacterium]|nr:hypothetical protein [Patescibacteria group bacterium]